MPADSNIVEARCSDITEVYLDIRGGGIEYLIDINCFPGEAI